MARSTTWSISAGIDQTEFGAADNVFPRVTDPVFRTAEPGGIRSGRAGRQPRYPTSYNQTSGFVFDSHPRTIRNLVVDQTANNPAAYATAYDPGVDGVLNFGAVGNDDVLKDGVQIVTSPGLDGKFGTADDRRSSSSTTWRPTRACRHRSTPG